jgi:NDP-sugar pyrophosphorylase family protein
VTDESKKMAAKLADQTVGEKPKLVAVIPAGGLGGQMYPVTSGMPKALLPVDDKPLLIQILKTLDKKVFRKCIILCDVWHKMIKNYLDVFQSQVQIEIECVETNKPLSLYLKDSLECEDKLSDPFLVHYCDILINNNDWEETIEVYERHKARKKITAMLLVSPVFNYSVGVVTTNAEENLVTNFDQKPQRIVAGYANCAVALLSRNFVDNYIKVDDSDIFDQAFVRVLKENKAIGIHKVGEWHHLQQIRDWLAVQKKYYEHVPF